MNRILFICFIAISCSDKAGLQMNKTSKDNNNSLINKNIKVSNLKIVEKENSITFEFDKNKGQQNKTKDDLSENTKNISFEEKKNKGVQSIEIENINSENNNSNSHNSDEESKVEDELDNINQAEFEYDGNSYRRCFPFSKRRYDIHSFPLDYEPSLLYYVNMNKLKLDRLLYENFVEYNPLKISEAAIISKQIGVTTNLTANCNITDIKIERHNIGIPFLRNLRFFGIRKKARYKCFINKNNNICRKDQYLFLTFKEKRSKFFKFLELGSFNKKNKKAKWHDFNPTKLCTLSDLKKNSTYPKIKLKLCGYLEYIFDCNQDQNSSLKYKYSINFNHKCLLDNLLWHTQKITKEYKNKTYTGHLTTLKDFEYVGYDDKKAMLVFFGLNDNCGNGIYQCINEENDLELEEENCCNFSFREINRLMRKGDNAKKYFFNLFHKLKSSKSSSRKIYINRIACNGKKTKVLLGVCNFIYVLDVWEKEKSPPNSYFLKYK